MKNSVGTELDLRSQLAVIRERSLTDVIREEIER
jgi:hypothetical protein